MELIGVRVRKPYKKNEKCYALQYHCDITDCPLRAQNECIHVEMLDRCTYGSVGRVTGWTPRAKKYSAFLKEWQQKAKENPITQPKERKIAFIGGYVWLPYVHMDHLNGKSKGIVFERYSHALSDIDLPFMPRGCFTPETIVKLVEFRPQALFGGTITHYFDEVVPRFLADLQEIDPELFENALSLKPEIEEIAAIARRYPVRLGWLNDIGWYGEAKIDDRKCFVDTNNIRFTLANIKQFPDSIGVIKVTVKLPPETLVYPDPANSLYIRLMKRARKDNAIVEKTESK